MDREKTKNKKSGLEFVTIKRGNMTKVKEKVVNPNTGEVQRTLVKSVRKKKSGDEVVRSKGYEKFSDGTSQKYKYKQEIGNSGRVQTAYKERAKEFDAKGKPLTKTKKKVEGKVILVNKKKEMPKRLWR